MNIETVPIDSLTPDPANVRKHSRRNLDAIKASLRRFGQQKPIVVDDKGVVIAGNGTLEAATEMGWKKISVVRSTLKGSERTSFAISDNRTAELAEWEDSELAQALSALQIEDGDLVKSTGFSEMELEHLVANTFNGETLDFGDAPESVQANIDHMEKIKQQRRKGNEAVADRNDTEKYLVVVFPTRDAKAAALKRLGLPDDERYVPAASVAIEPIAKLPPVSRTTGAKSADKRKSGAAG